MLAFLVRRLSIGFLTLLLITCGVYGLVRAMPGSPITMVEDRGDLKRRMSEADRQALLKQYGLDKPWYEAYAKWITDMARGEMGRSFARKRPVADVINERIGPTLMLSSTSLVLAYLLSVPMGLYAVARSGKLDERIMGLSLYVLYSFPSFVAALMLQLFVSVRMGWLPLYGMQSDEYATMSAVGKSWDLIKHAILPVVVFTYGSLAYYTRFIHANMQEVVRQDYIRTAQAKGLGPFAVIVKHAFRNTLIPFVTKIGLSLPSLLSGSVIIEKIFNWPGLGQLYFSAILERDYPVIMALTLIYSVLTLAGQLLADVLYALVDPRVRIEDGG
jgi:peptide/nickel transport system permease protein